MLYLFSQDVCFYVFKMFCSFKVQRSVVALHSRPSCHFCFHDHIQYFDHLLTPAFKSRTALFFKSLQWLSLQIPEMTKKKSCESQDLFHHQSQSPSKLIPHVFSSFVHVYDTYPICATCEQNTKLAHLYQQTFFPPAALEFPYQRARD